MTGKILYVTLIILYYDMIVQYRSGFKLRKNSF